MSTDRWRLLSTWHNAWLVAGPEDQERLRAEFVIEHPELAAQADALAAASARLPGFLETPALMLAARDLASQDALLGADRLVGPYRIVELLARGGMGDVYRATDVRLRRDVALKLLAHSAQDHPQRVERFLQESRLTAALDHVNIVKVFDVGVVDGRPYLVAELLDGETLGARLQRGALGAAEARRIARDVSAGLVAAHAAGLVHRDLKPDNVFLTHSGVTKILDFGIAKPTAEADAEDRVATLAGVMFGTPGYLAPEQIRGGAVDGRTDLFALGAMLYEMLTGRPPFARELTIDTLHAVLHTAALDLPALPDSASDLAPVVMRLLEKAPDRRFQSAADVEWILAQGLLRAHDRPAAARTEDSAAVDLPGANRAQPRRSRTMVSAVVATAGMILVLTGWAMWSRPGTIDRGELPARFLMAPPQDNRFGSDPERTHLAFSPDGSQLAFIARSSEGGAPRIWLRPVAEVDARPIGGTDGARSLFWSPDGRSLAFFAGNTLQRLDLPAGVPVRVCAVDEVIGLTGTWGGDGRILIGSVRGDVIQEVSAGTDSPASLIHADRSIGEARVNWPWFLPDGRQFLYQSRRRDGTGWVMLGERGRPARPLLPAVSNAQWIDPDLVVFVRDGTLLAQRVDLAGARTVGEPVPIAGPITYIYSTGRAEFTAAWSGRIAYASRSDTSRLVWRDRQGASIEEIGTPGNYQSIRIASDGGRVVFERYREGLGTPDVWALDLVRGGETRLTTDFASETNPILLGDGASLVFMADRNGNPPNVFRKSLMTGQEAPLAPATQMQAPDDVSPDGSTLAFEQRTARGNYDILAASLAGAGTPTVLLGSSFDETGLRFSPDGRAVAFISDESGRYDVYVAPFPAMAPKLLVSSDGGRAPRWNPRGGELLYLTGDERVMAVPVTTTPALALGASKRLFSLPKGQSWIDFAMSVDGRRFLSIESVSRGDEQPLTIVLGSAGGPTRR